MAKNLITKEDRKILRNKELISLNQNLGDSVRKNVKKCQSAGSIGKRTKSQASIKHEFISNYNNDLS